MGKIAVIYWPKGGSTENAAKKKVALFGLGNQVLYPNHFVNDMAILFERFNELKANLIGKWSVESYEFKNSTAV